MANITQLLKELILNKQDIANMQVPLNELCMIQHEAQSYGPIWTHDLQEIKSQLASDINDMRWRKFGTETWVPLSQLLGAVDVADLEQSGDDDITMLVGDVQIEMAHSEEQEQLEQEEELFTGVHQQNVLPPPPSREQFAWGREEVAKNLQEHQATQKDDHGEAMASLIKLLKINSNPTTAAQKSEEKERQAAEKISNTPPPSEKMAAPNGASAILKVSAAAVAGLLVLVGLRLGIERLPDSILAFNNKSDSEQDNEKKELVNGVATNVKSSSGRAKNRAPASDSGRNRKKQALERNKSRNNNNNSFRDSDAYQRPEIGADGAGFNDVDRTVDAEYNMDDGSAPAEQDPLRRKLGRDTVNPDPTDHSGLPQHEERSPASEEVPETSMEPPPEENQVVEE